ncbi:hypothetical protein MBLNU459_g0696t1 [Dothideomycetes sp. NU459]
MAQRKLQQEIDKTFKRVAEGVASFESIYDKLQASTNAAQKEKLEDNLKKEIKKLQRSRDQIKAWAAQNDIKDKKPLLDQRKLIETQMEKFKAVEKEMKTKAFSKEGLSAAAKLDPKEKEKLEMGEFLSTMVSELEQQIEATEAEAETLQANMKKGKKDTGKADRIAELERTAERHKWHQSKLELLLRSLENGGVDTDQVKDIEDGIKYYVENNQEVDFMEDDSIYDDLNLDADEEMFGMQNDADRVSSQDAQSVQDELPESETTSRSASIAPPKPKPSNQPEPPSVAARRPSLQLKSPLPALATLHTSLPTNGNGAAPAGMKPAPLPTIPTGQTLKYASAAAAAAASDKSGVGIAPLPPPPGTSAAAPFTAKPSSSASPATVPSIPATVQPSPSQPAPPTPAKSSETPARSPQEAPQPAEAAAAPAEHRQLTPALEKAKAGPVSGIATSNGEIPQTAASPEVYEEDDDDNNNNNNDDDDDDDESIFHLPSNLSDLLDSFAATKARLATSSPPDERLLALSRAACPSPADVEKPNHYKPQSPYAYTPSHYPQEPLAIFDDQRLYSRIDTDTLFYAFYYRQGTYQQYCAAKALKSQSWRFHKQYQTWFQRHEEPKNITDEYEQGTYRFFDYESTWMNRRKADFKFAYKFLEDDL